MWDFLVLQTTNNLGFKKVRLTILYTEIKGKHLITTADQNTALTINGSYKDVSEMPMLTWASRLNEVTYLDA